MKIIYYFRLIRLHNIAIACLTILLSAYLVNIYQWNQIIICMMLTIFSMSFANSMNDILDVKSDKVNHPHRVLIRNLISKREAQFICLLSFFISIIISFFLKNIDEKIFFYSILLILTTYNIFFKKFAFFGNIIISLLLANVFIFTEFILTNQVNFLIIPAVLAFSLSFLRESIKDLHDYFGDKSFNMKTLPIILGIKGSCYAISLFIIFASLVFIAPYYYGMYGFKYFISLILFIEIPLFYSLFLLLNFQTIETFKQLGILYKLLTISGLFVILITKT